MGSVCRGRTLVVCGLKAAATAAVGLVGNGCRNTLYSTLFYRRQNENSRRQNGTKCQGKSPAMPIILSDLMAHSDNDALDSSEQHALFLETSTTIA